MQILQMSLLILSAGLFDNILTGSSNVIPSKEEQANLLLNVQEVFEQVKILVNVEGNSTDESVVCDLNKMVQRAKDKLALIEELTLTRLSRDVNSVCALDSKQAIQKLIRRGKDELKDCVRVGSSAIKTNSRQLTNVTEAATERGQDLLDTLYDCSRKSGFQVVTCYKDVINKDVAPVKKMLLGAIDAHKKGHLRAIEIRNCANDCVDGVLEKYQLKIAESFLEAARCV